MVKCPQCKKETPYVLKEWDYSRFRVKRFHCTICSKSFNGYYRLGKLTHIISNEGHQKGLRTAKSKIAKYLKEHGTANEEEISNGLNLTKEEVLRTLLILEKKGIVAKAPPIS